jgi:DNA-binding SARP family transcriptional activator
MGRLAISVLGIPRIEMGGMPLAVDRRKAVALLVYLALSEGTRSRDTLATLLWPGYDQATARAATYDERSRSCIPRSAKNGC